jgi:predicted enzyme related to lactoylglutathione lyase
MFNSERPEELVEFWSKFLEVDAHPHNSNTEHIWLFPQEAEGVKLGFQRVDKKSIGNAEIHIDIAVTNLDEAEERAINLGGAIVSRTRIPNGFEWRVLEDPQGNPFCIYIPFEELNK